MAIRSESYANALTSADVKELEEQAHQQGELIYQATEFGTQCNLPRKLGEGGARIIHLRGGLTIDIRKATLWQTIRHTLQHEHSFPLVSKFYLSGSSRVQTPGVSDIENDYEEVAGSHYLYHLPNLTEFEEWPSGKLIHVLMVYVDADYFCSFNLEGDVLPKPLQELMQGNLAKRFHQPLGKITPAMNQVVQQILHCPYQGVTQQLYLESKALELFTLQFAHWAERYRQSAQVVNLHPNDIERLYHAREIILNNFNNPPSLIEIARQVGLNDYKLKQGFRQVFGTTLFGYLHDYRMQQARQLLLNSHLSIAGIAAMVGYRNPEAFSTAFRRKFTVSPKAYQLGKFN